MKMKKAVIAGACWAAILMCSVSITLGAQEESNGAPSIFVPQPTHTFDPVFEGNPVSQDFVIQNKGTGPLNVKKVTGG